MIRGTVRVGSGIVLVCILLAVVWVWAYASAKPAQPLAAQHPEPNVQAPAHAAEMKARIARYGVPSPLQKVDLSQIAPAAEGMPPIYSSKIRTVPGMASSSREFASNEARAERQAEWRAYFDKVDRETLEESVAMLRKESIWRPFGLISLMVKSSSGPVDIQKDVLTDPRGAKIMAASVGGTPAERQIVLDSSLNDLHSYVEKPPRPSEGAPVSLTPLVPNGAVMLPLLLAELDETGQSLPDLVDLYDREYASAQQFTEYIDRVSGGKTGRISSGTQSMQVIAAGALRIMQRLVPEETWEDGLNPTIAFGPAQQFHPLGGPAPDFLWSESWKASSAALEGSQLLPHLTFEQQQLVMNRVRGYLNTRR